LEATGDLFFRIARAANQLGISQKEALEITDSLAKAMTASGISAGEAAGPLLQIGQALQSGRFQGDELRSVLEGMPAVSQALANELGVSIGELKELGSQGKITADVFISAMRKARDSINEAFARTAPTVSQAFENLKTQAGLAFNEFEKGTGVGRSTAAAIELLGFSLFKLTKNIDEIVDKFAFLAKVVGSIVAFTVAGRIIRAFISTITSAVTGIATLGSNLREVWTRISQFGKTLEAAGKNAEGFAGTISFVIAPLRRFLEALGAVIAAIYTFTGLDNFFKWFKSLGEEGSDAQKDLQAYRKELLEYQQALSDVAPESLNAARAAELQGQAMQKLNSELTKASRAYYEQAVSQQVALKTQLDQIGMDEARIKLMENLAQAEANYLRERQRLQDELNKAIGANDINQQSMLIMQLDELEQQYQRQVAVVTELTGKINEKVAAQKLEAETLAVDKAVDAYIKQNEQLNRTLTLQGQRLRMSELERDISGELEKVENQRLSALQPLIERIAELKRSSNESDKAMIPVLEAGLARINSQYELQKQQLTEILKSKEQELRITKQIEFANKTQLDLQRDLRKIQDETAKLTMSDIERKYYDIAASARESARAAIEAEQARRGAPLSTAEIENYYKVARESAEKLITATEQHNKKARSWETGWKRAYKSYVENAKNAAKTAEQVFDKATKGMEDAIVGFVKTGKFEWKGFVSDIAEQLLRSGIQRTFAGIIESITGTTGGAKDSILGQIGDIFGVGGGQGYGQMGSRTNPMYVSIVSGSGYAGTGQLPMPSISSGGGFVNDVSKIVNTGKGIWDAVTGFGGDLLSGVNDLFGGFFANGGTIPSGKFGVVGERGPELVSGPATVTPMSAQTVVYNINAVDAASFKQLVARDPAFIHAVAMKGGKAIPMGR
jgi:lambda family phage tail tape measure protein